jgi:chromosomal replication initiation ATPase DnaA
VNLRKQVYLGGEGFRRRVGEQINKCSRSSEIPGDHRHRVRPTFDAIVSATTTEFEILPEHLPVKRRSPARMAVAYLARTEAGLSLCELGLALGVKRWTASRLALEAERLMAEDRDFGRRVDKIRRVLAKITRSET